MTTLAFALGMCVGLLIGIVVGLALYERSFATAARYQRTGRPDAPPVVHAPRTDPSPEASASRQVTQDMVEHGAADLLRAARAQGVPMSTKEAARQARELIEAAGGGLGGVT